VSVSIEWCEPAFTELEALPESISFEIIGRVDLLESFPEMGVPLESRYRALERCRQLVIRRKYRVLYEFDATAGRIVILAIQACRRQLPTTRELRRRYGSLEP
jgi:mRNA-degrading endonuclease RelE of RelBE toxin-antitoxin system